MATIGYAELPVPGGGDAPVGPANLADLATAIDPHLWQDATDLADRDSKYSAAPALTVVRAPDGSVWLKTSSVANDWFTIAEPLGSWVPLTLASGFEAGQTDPEARIDRGQVYLRGRIQRVDATPIAVSGVKLATVPTACIPNQISSFAGGASLTGDPAIGVGRVEVFSPDQDGNALGARGSVIWYSQDGTGVPWVDISGSYWLD